MNSERSDLKGDWLYVVVESEWCQTWCSWSFCLSCGWKRWWFFRASLLLLRGFFGGWWTGSFKWWLPEIMFMDGFLWKRPRTENEVWPKWWQTRQLLLQRRVQLQHKMLRRQETTPSWRLKENTKSRPMDFRTTPGIGLYSQRQPLSPWWSESLCISLHSKLFGHLRAIFFAVWSCNAHRRVWGGQPPENGAESHIIRDVSSLD